MTFASIVPTGVAAPVRSETRYSCEPFAESFVEGTARYPVVPVMSKPTLPETSTPSLPVGASVPEFAGDCTATTSSFVPMTNSVVAVAGSVSLFV